ncbi:uncharacterized protein LOC100678010 [Nasonia vitripennis]|uniref:Uncharacterized protein n=1 Tax=Nasonia vitripennis TaxID=7425 RepID=A0A7M7GIY9_NASVI|nr:uncharacterized protein LOC100678010 [Nasonia vitripennis]XP_032455106.1 uncharacterized protein LOC100678010 [Nasonia vitripennis]
MEKELHKCLVEFFSKLETTDIKWKELQNNTERVIEALKNQTGQLHHVTSSEVDNAELCKVEGLRERLIFKIHAGIENEVACIQEAVTRLNNNSQDLKNRLMKIEATRSKLSLEDENLRELVNGTARRPKLNSLLEWAIDACDYYHNLYRQLSESLKALDYKDTKSVERLAESFVERESTRMRIDRILTYTQFIARETVR